jgi:5'-nucleotidase
LGLVLVDLDGVLADFERGLLNAFRTRHASAQAIELADRRVFYARDQYAEQFGPEWGKTVHAITCSEGFYRNLPVIAGAVEALGEMREERHEVFLCTSPLTGSPWCVPEKLAWVEDYLSKPWLDRVIIAKDKTLVGDRLQSCVLVDDRPTIKGIADPPPWKHVLFDAPYNQGQPGPRLSSWTDWRDVLIPYLGVD